MVKIVIMVVTTTGGRGEDSDDGAEDKGMALMVQVMVVETVEMMVMVVRMVM